jgi:hypothetical protein
MALYSFVPAIVGYFFASAVPFFTIVSTFMGKILILIAFGAIVVGCSKQGDTQEYDSTGSSTSKTSSSSQYSAPAPNPSAVRGTPPPASDTPKPIDTSSTHY